MISSHRLARPIRPKLPAIAAPTPPRALVSSSSAAMTKRVPQSLASMARKSAARPSRSTKRVPRKTPFAPDFSPFRIVGERARRSLSTRLAPRVEYRHRNNASREYAMNDQRFGPIRIERLSITTGDAMAIKKAVKTLKPEKAVKAIRQPAVSRMPVSETNLRKAAARLLSQTLVSTEVQYIQHVLGATATQKDMDDKVLAVRKMPWASIVLPDA